MDAKQLIATLSDIASLINAERDTDTILRQMIAAACRHLGWYRGTIMSIDLASGYAYVTVRYDPSLLPNAGAANWALATSPSLVALRYNEPVFISNAKTSAEFPGFQKESIEKNYSSVLVVPMNCTDIDSRPIVLTLVSREIKSLSPDDLALIKLIVQLGTIALEKQRNILDQQKAVEQKQEVLARHTQWMEQALSDDSVKNLAAVIGPALNQPMLVIDSTTNTVLPGRSPDPRYFDDREWGEYVERELATRIQSVCREGLKNATSAKVDLSYARGTQNFSTIARLRLLEIDGQSAGALCLLGDEDIQEMDLLLIESAKQALSVQLMRNLIRFQFEQRSLDALFLEIIEGTWKSENDVAQRALKYGLKLNSPNRMIMISFVDADRIPETVWNSMLRGLSFLAEHIDPRAVVIARPDAMIFILPVGSSKSLEVVKPLMNRLVQELGRASHELPTMVVGDVCSDLAQYRDQFRKQASVLSIAVSLGKRGVVSTSMLGPLSMLLVSADLAQVRVFTKEVLGPVLQHDAENETQFFETLEAFMDAGYRNQQCADRLGIHVTTLRYRLTRMTDLFKLDLDTSSRRFELELAVRIFKLLND
ncbi:helix-turn-helix domain-containing protein [Pararhizobium sp. DWP1-1-3]|uniref:helix-turn-helix domain-containing protein n=1 Tax=Pararhizobium sp. DWP1-1-3 TaxID=2804652 RepID=UPI003CF59B11